MTIEAPLPGDTRSRVADWLEICALANPRGQAGQSNILRLHGFMHDRMLDSGIDEETNDPPDYKNIADDGSQLAEDALAEITHRVNVLNAYYPFDVHVHYRRWNIATLAPSPDVQVDAARTCYLFCLLTSAVRDHRIDVGPDDTFAIPLHFQALSVAAAASVLNGDVFSFGWPRPDRSGFLPALAAACRRMRVGRPRDQAPPHVSPQAKDAGIDVIAWKDFRDGRPAKLIMLGQAASGLDWRSKSVEGEIWRFLRWFERPPCRHFIPAIFIPFPLHHDLRSNPVHGFEENACRTAGDHEHGFGVIIDRLRIVETAGPRLAAGDDQTLAALRAWTERILARAKRTP